MLDSRRFVYIALAIFVAATATLLIQNNLSLGFVHTSLRLPLLFIAPFLPLLVYRSEGIAWLDRIISGFECFGLFVVISFVGCIASYSMAAMSSGWVDSYLIALDKFIGLDWPAYWAFTENHPLFKNVLYEAYASIGYSPVAIIAILAGTGNFDRLYRFLAAYLICIVVTDMSLFYFPATSAAAHFLPVDLPDRPMAGIAHIKVIEDLRSGRSTVIQLTELLGLIAIPSFHAAACVLYSWATWCFGKVRFLFLALNGLMVLSTPIHGGHYFSDVAAGVLLAVAVIAACHGFSPIVMRYKTRKTKQVEPCHPSVTESYAQ